MDKSPHLSELQFNNAQPANQNLCLGSQTEIQKHNVSLSEKLLWEAIVIKAFGLPKHSILLLYYSREGKLHNPQIMAQTMISMGSMHGNTRVQE